jgi:hypothetical protein
MRKLLTAVLMLLLFQAANSQGRFGVKAGTNFFILHSENNKQQDYNNGKFGYTFGASYELMLTKSFGVQPELNYAYLHAEEDYYGSKIRMNYYQVPILFHYYSKVDPVAFYAGPQVSFLGNAKVRSADGKTTKVNDNMNQTDFGVAFGVSRVPLDGKKGITFDVRVYRGLMNVIKAEYDGGIKTRATIFSATIGYLFGK